MAVIRRVDPASPLYGRISAGEDLLEVNGKPIRDFLDYLYQTAMGVTDVTVLRDGKRVSVPLPKPAEELGLDFDTYLMDRQRSCKNKCIFCFIDQLPPKMRETMYYKDDDYRLSLLYGNYVTMTNMTEEDVARIAEMHVSPFNVSVHTTNPELRVKMMKNPAASRCMEHLRTFRDAGINLRAQIVLCPGWNDGKELDRTLNDLKTLYPHLSSVSVVPVGLTKFRDGLEPLRTFTPDECRAVTEQVDRFGDACLREWGDRLVYCSDEWYLKAGIPLPPFEYYGEFEQLENGVGMVANFERDLEEALEYADAVSRPVRVSLATGKIAEGLMTRAVERIRTKFSDLSCPVYGIRNDFFGTDVTVTGLVTGTDLIAQLTGKELGDFLLIPDVMLRDDRFLDDLSVAQVEKALGVKIRVTETGADGLLDALTRSVR